VVNFTSINERGLKSAFGQQTFTLLAGNPPQMEC